MKKCVLRFSRYAFFVLIPLFVLFTFCSCSGLFSDNETNYPAFWWAEHYSGSNNLGDYGTGWYLPAKNEMLAIYNNRTAISTAFGKIGTTYATDFGSSGDWEYWSSTQYPLEDDGDGEYWAWAIDFADPEDFTEDDDKNSVNSVRAVRVFQ